MNDRIKELRKYLGLNQTEFGEKIGAKQATVAGWEVKRREPSDMVINTICTTFNVNEEWLRTGTGEMFVQLSQEEELAEFLADIQKSDDSDPVKKILLAFMRLPKDKQEEMKNIIDRMMENK